MINRLKQFVGTEDWQVEPDKGIGDASIFLCGENEWGAYTSFKSPNLTSLMQDLANQLSGKKLENEELQERIDELTQRLDRHEQLLQEIFDPTSLPILGTFEEWLASDLANTYRGKHVAFIAGKGVVAASETLDDLVENVQAKWQAEGLTIGFVPTAVAPVSKC